MKNSIRAAFVHISLIFKRIIGGIKWGFADLEHTLEAERTRWVLWIPVALGIGIGLYFSLNFEPQVSLFEGICFALAAIFFLGIGFLTQKILLSFGSWTLFWGISGFFLALMRTNTVDPYLLLETTEPLWTSGVVESIDHPASAHCLFQRIVLRLDHREYKDKEKNYSKNGWSRKNSQKIIPESNSYHNHKKNNPSHSHRDHSYSLRSHQTLLHKDTVEQGISYATNSQHPQSISYEKESRYHQNFIPKRRPSPFIDSTDSNNFVSWAFGCSTLGTGMLDSDAFFSDPDIFSFFSNSDSHFHDFSVSEALKTHSSFVNYSPFPNDSPLKNSSNSDTNSSTRTGYSLLPKKVMITIRTACAPLLEGDRIRLKVILTPLPGPCFVGAHDPRRQFFFQGIGASGFALTTPRLLSRNPSVLSRWRHTLTRQLHAFLPPPLGAMACGLVTGDKIALPQNIRQEFADSGLAHLLAIAGLHMSILSGLCFMLFQRSLARIPSLALYVNLDRIAAFLSLCVGWMYWMISGQRYPVQRAFFMMAASMLSMIVGRRRHSMRILMLCAATFLILQPESLLSLSFQLSFAAVGGLIAVYEGRMQWRYRERWKKPWKKKKFHRMWRFVSDSLWSTGSITWMTLPIMIHHFYHVSFQGFLSNMVAIPFTAAVIMPLGIVALIGLSTPWAWIFMGIWGMSLQGLMAIAAFSAHYGAWMIGWFRPHDSFFFALEMLGVCWILLWQKRWRWWGSLLWLGASISGHIFRVEPVFLVDSDHKLVAHVDKNQSVLWVSSLRRGKWAAQRWSQAFGVPEIRLWPEDKVSCEAAAMPWYATHGDKYSKEWSLDLGLGDNILLWHQNLGPKTGCMMLDASGQNLNGQEEIRPWTRK